MERPAAGRCGCRAQGCTCKRAKDQKAGKKAVDAAGSSAEGLGMSMKAKARFCLLMLLGLLLVRAEGQPILITLEGMLVTNRAEIPPGLSTIANPFSRSSWDGSGSLTTDNRVAALFPRVPVGTTLFKFHLDTQRYSVDVFGRRGWSNPGEVLNPGEGAMILNPTRQTIGVEFCTGFWQNGVAEDIPYGWSLVSCPQIDFHPAEPAPPGGFTIYPADLISFDAPGEWMPIYDFPPVFIGWEPRPLFAYSFFPQDGDIVCTFNRVTHEFDRHTYRTTSGWDSIPVVADTESFFVYTRHPRQIGLYTYGYAW